MPPVVPSASFVFPQGLDEVPPLFWLTQIPLPVGDSPFL